MAIESQRIGRPTNETLPNVVHLMESYATTGENYVYEQVNYSQRFCGHLLAEWDLRLSIDPIIAQHRQTFRKVFRWPYFERVARYLSRNILEGFYLGRFNQFLYREITQRNGRLIHAHFGMMACKALPVVERTGLPLIVSFYGVDASQAVKDPYWQPRLVKMLAVAEKVIVLCDEARDRLLALGCAAEKIEIWDIGIPLSEYSYRPPRMLTEGATTRFLTVARFVEKKGYPYLLSAFHRLVSNGYSVHLTIAGNGPLKEFIEQQIEELNLKAHIRLIDTFGQRDFFKLFKELLRDNDIFVLPSVIAKNGDDEGGPPVVIANAQAVGLPVISTPIGGITRAIKNEKTGYLVEPESVDSLYETMSRLVKNPSLLYDISRQARAHVEEHFDVIKQLTRIEQVYDEVIAASN